MLWKISFFDLKPHADFTEFRQHETELLAAYQPYLREAGQQYVGFYQVTVKTVAGSALTGFAFKATYAEICLVDATGVEAALVAEASVPRPAEVQSMLNRRLTYFSQERRLCLWFQPMLLSPFGHAPIQLKARLIHVVLRNMPPERRLDDLVAFDERIIERYTTYMTQAKWQHIGLYHAFGLPDYMYVDSLDLIEAASVEEALANDAAVPVTPEMRTIYDECDLYLDRSRERFQIWFVPFIPCVDTLPALDSGSF